MPTNQKLAVFIKICMNMSNSLAKEVLQWCFFMLGFFCSFTAHYHISLRNNTKK